MDQTDPLLVQLAGRAIIELLANLGVAILSDKRIAGQAQWRAILRQCFATLLIRLKSAPALGPFQVVVSFPGVPKQTNYTQKDYEAT